MLNPFSINYAFGCYFNPMHMYCIPVHTSVGLVWEVNPKYQSFVHTHHTLKQVCEGVWTWSTVSFVFWICWHSQTLPRAFDGHLALWPSNVHALIAWVQCATIEIQYVYEVQHQNCTNANIWASINWLQGEEQTPWEMVTAHSGRDGYQRDGMSCYISNLFTTELFPYDSTLSCQQCS